MGVDVGWGIRSFCPLLRGVQSAGRLFSNTMLCTETLKRIAILLHVSPGLTVYSVGGFGVDVGRGVLVRVDVAVGVIDAVVVDVGVAV